LCAPAQAILPEAGLPFRNFCVNAGLTLFRTPQRRRGAKAVRLARVADQLSTGLSRAKFLTPFVRDSVRVISIATEIERALPAWMLS